MKFPMGTRLTLCGALLMATSVVMSAQQEKPDLRKLREEIGLLESVINERLAQTFGSPFGYLDKARGAYLPGYGAVFTLDVSLTPLQSLGPFTPTPTPERERARREEETRAREKARAMPERILADFGHTLSHLAPNESVAIIIHTVSVQQEGVQKGAIIVQATKQLIDEYRASTVDRATFVRKLQVLEY